VVLRAELGEVSAERDELVATVGALRAKVVELTKQAFGARSERGKATAGDDDGPGRAPGAAEDSNGGGGNEGREAGGVKRKRGQQPGSRGHGRRSYDHLPRQERVLMPSTRAAHPHRQSPQPRDESPAGGHAAPKTAATNPRRTVKVPLTCMILVAVCRTHPPMGSATAIGEPAATQTPSSGRVPAGQVMRGRPVVPINRR